MSNKRLLTKKIKGQSYRKYFSVFLTFFNRINLFAVFTENIEKLKIETVNKMKKYCSSGEIRSVSLLMESMWDLMWKIMLHQNQQNLLL